jgi:hypothetical protein
MKTYYEITSYRPKSNIRVRLEAEPHRFFWKAKRRAKKWAKDLEAMGMKGTIEIYRISPIFSGAYYSELVKKIEIGG